MILRSLCCVNRLLSRSHTNLTHSVVGPSPFRIRLASSMPRAVVAEEWGKPELKEMPAIHSPSDGNKMCIVRTVTGKHYSANTLPHTLGTDGVGRLDDGTIVYFISLVAGGGGFCDELLLPKSATWPLPEGANPLEVAALMNPASATYYSIVKRWAARSDYPDGYKVLVLGATSATGQVAAKLTRQLGAKQVIGAARSKTSVEKLGLFDGAIGFGDDGKTGDWSSVQDVDLIIDLVWGQVVVRLLEALPSVRPVTLVQVGILGGEQTVNLDCNLLRGKNITLNPAKDVAANTGPLLETLVKSGAKGNVRVEKLADFVKVFNEPVIPGQRLVFEP